MAHWYGFRLSARLMAAGAVRRGDLDVAAAQLAGAAVVAVLATLPVVLLDGSWELGGARLLLAAFIAIVGFLVARTSGATTVKATVYGATTLVVAGDIAILKNVLAGH